ncbi:MAG TPA: hypothetical protein VJM12_18130 [Pyrinomonadaceae bacterium]|nr:hypothetical protein [Pyrinomonadaceae bacterium]
MTWFIHPRYLSSYAAAADRDPDLREGTHLRLFPSDVIGFPLAPWGLWELPALMTEDLPIQWFDRQGRSLPALDLDAADGEAIGWIFGGLPNQARLIGVELLLAGGGPGEIAVLNHLDDSIDDRVITSRSSGRLLVGAPRIIRVRVRGRGPFRFLGWTVLEDHAFERIVGRDPFTMLSAPLDGDFPWYAGGQGREEAASRVALGAPKRWTRPDRPDGPFDPLGSEAEKARVAVFRPELDEKFLRLVSDPGTRPGDVTRIHVSPATAGRPWQEVIEHIQGSLMLMALDPGAGRYAGLLTLLQHLPDMADQPEPPSGIVWLSAGLFACRRGARLRLPEPDAMEERLIERLIQLEPSAGRVVGMIRNRELAVRAFVTPALAAPVPDAPVAPVVSLGDAAWLRPEQGPSVAFRQQLRVTAQPLATLIALARLESSGWVTRHKMLELAPGSVPNLRAAPMLLGSSQSLTDGRFAVVEENAIPVNGAPWVYQLALSDVFGRYGEPAEIHVPLPPRPPIPVPTIRIQLKLAERAPHDQPAASGSVRVTVPVPSLEEMGAGSRPLKRVWISLGGATENVPTPQIGGTLVFEFALPALMPMEHRHLEVRARFENDQGTLGDEGVEPFDIADPRSPAVPKTGIGIVWSSRPGPAQEVEIRVRFAGLAQARYRVYASDARGLGIPLTEVNRPRTRAEVAVDGAQRGLTGIGLRERFRLLTEKPIETGADGSVQFDARFPRSLETVQFLRFVPLGARGSEAAFESCPLLPVAVPSDRRPPAPRIEVRVDQASGAAHVTVVAEGIDLIGLEAAEPGLFLDPPAQGSQPPEFRLRRASGAVPDAIYAREIARGTLERQGIQFQAAVTDHPGTDGLIPFVRYYYWAEVRMPPERRLPPDIQEITLPLGAIQPLQPAQREDAPAAYSAPSAPAMAMRVPLQVEELSASMVTATLSAAPGGWRLGVVVAGGPRANPRAVGQHRVRIHVERKMPVPNEEDSVLNQEAEEPLVGGALSWELVVLETPPPASVRVALVLIDPIGRASAPLFIDVTAP